MKRNGVLPKYFNRYYRRGYKYGIRMHNASDPRLHMGSDQKYIGEKGYEDF